MTTPDTARPTEPADGGFPVMPNVRPMLQFLYRRMDERKADPANPAWAVALLDSVESVVAYHGTALLQSRDNVDDPWIAAKHLAALITLRDLVAPYRDHPDFDPAWVPTLGDDATA